MESRAFIRNANALGQKITLAALSSIAQSPEQYATVKKEIQKELNQLFIGLHNPTLMAAGKLRDIALQHQYTIDHHMLQRLAEFDKILG